MNARRQFFLAVAISWSACSYAVARSDEPDRLATLHAGHPRLLFTAEDQARIQSLAESDELLARLIRQNHVNAAAMLDTPPVRYEIPDGKQLLAQSRRCIERVTAMAMAYRLSGERRFAEGAIKEMLVAAEFKDWNPRHFLGMVTAAEIQLDGPRALLRQGGKTLQADILAPGGARFELGSTQPPTKREEQNAGTRILVVNLVCRPEERAEMSVLLQPVQAGQTAITVTPKPLDQW